MPDFHLLLQNRVKGHFNGFPTPAMGLEFLQGPANMLHAISCATCKCSDDSALHDSALQNDGQNTGCEYKLGHEICV